MPLDEDSIQSFKEKYNFLHPLLFHRSLEKAESSNGLFEILESIPKSYPLFWDDSKKKWVSSSDFLFIKKAKSIIS